MRWKDSKHVTKNPLTFIFSYSKETGSIKVKCDVVFQTIKERFSFPFINRSPPYLSLSVGWGSFTEPWNMQLNYLVFTLLKISLKTLDCLSQWNESSCFSNKWKYRELNLDQSYKYIRGWRWLVWFGLILWHINHCWLFNAKSSLYIYIKYIHDL